MNSTSWTPFGKFFRSVFLLGVLVASTSLIGEAQQAEDLILWLPPNDAEFFRPDGPLPTDADEELFFRDLRLFLAEECPECPAISDRIRVVDIRPKISQDLRLKRQILGQQAIFKVLTDFIQTSGFQGRIQIEFFDWEELLSVLENLGVTERNRQPHIAVAPSSWIAYLADRGILTAQPVDTSLYIPEALKTCLYDGRYYAFPWLVDVRLLFFWKEFFRASDLADRDAFRQSLRGVTSKSPAAPSLAFALPIEFDWELLHVSSLVLWGAGGDWESGYRASALPETWRDMVSFLRSLQAGGAGFIRSRRSVLEEQLLEHRLGALITGPWYIARLQKGALKDRWAQQIGVSLPPLNLPGTLNRTYIGGLHLGITPRGDTNALSLELVKYLTTEGAKYFASKGLALPGARSAYDLYMPDHAELRIVLDQAIRQSRQFPALPAWATEVEAEGSRSELFQLYKHVAGGELLWPLADRDLTAFHDRLRKNLYQAPRSRQNMLIGFSVAAIILFLGAWRYHSWKRNQIEELKAQYDRARDRNAQLEAEIASMLDEVQSQSARLSELEKALNNKDHQCTGLQDRIDNQNKLIDFIKEHETSDKLQSEIAVRARLETELQIVKIDRDSTRKALETTQKQITKLQDQIREGIDDIANERVAAEKIRDRLGKAGRSIGFPTVKRKQPYYFDSLAGIVQEQVRNNKHWLEESVIALTNISKPSKQTLVDATREDSNRRLADHRRNARTTPTPILDALGRDLTEAALLGMLDPLIGRVEEIGQIFQVLSKRKKRNPIVVGPPGVGKTALAAGLAERIAFNKESRFLNHRLIEVTPEKIITGGPIVRRIKNPRGERDDRVHVGDIEMVIEAVVTEAKKAENVILMIDEIHALLSFKVEGAIIPSDALKSALTDPSISIIGYTTQDEYLKFIKPAAALERRFRLINVNPPSVTETISIMQGLRAKYESHHGVTLDDDIIELAVEVSDRYIRDRFQPDKVIDLLDEASVIAKQKGRPSVRPSDLKEALLGLANLTEEPVDLCVLGLPGEALDTIADSDGLVPFKLAAAEMIQKFEKFFPLRIPQDGDERVVVDEKLARKTLDEFRESLPAVLGFNGDEYKLTLLQHALVERAKPESEDLNVHFLYWLFMKQLELHGRNTGTGKRTAGTQMAYIRSALLFSDNTAKHERFLEPLVKAVTRNQ
ncbi:MAG: extracellular solute-binding protein [Acidobacteria bacterium]|nr:extracellular solute-binding protein [Acidobacteriota bacterium]